MNSRALSIQIQYDLWGNDNLSTFSVYRQSSPCSDISVRNASFHARSELTMNYSSLVSGFMHLPYAWCFRFLRVILEDNIYKFHFQVSHINTCRLGQWGGSHVKIYNWWDVELWSFLVDHDIMKGFLHFRLFSCKEMYL